jgi:hypothetical protein
MDAATLMERIDREIQEQAPLFAALHEALSSCDPGVQFAVPRSVLASLEPAGVSTRVNWPQRNAALYGAV